MTVITCFNGATTKPYPLAEDIRVAATAGFSAVEIWYGKLQDFLAKWSAADLRQMLADTGIIPASICPLFPRPFDPDPYLLDRFRHTAAVAREIGCGLIVVPPQVPPVGMGIGEARHRLADNLHNLCVAVSEFGVQLALEPVGRHSLVPDPESALSILALTDHPSAGLLMDTFHYYRSGVTPADLDTIPTERLLMIHVNGCEDLPIADLTDAHRLYPGLGPMPGAAMVAAVRQRGYDGPISVETFRPEYWGQPPEQVAQRAREHLQRLLTIDVR